MQTAVPIESRIVTQGTRALPVVVPLLYFLCAYFGLYFYKFLLPLEVQEVFERTDEALTLFLFIPIVLRLFLIPKEFRTVAMMIAIFVFASVFSTLVHPLDGFPQIRAAIVGLFLDMKVWIALLGFALIVRGYERQAAKPIRLLLNILALSSFVSLVFCLRDVWVGSTNIYGDSLRGRLGIPIPTGLFVHKAQLAQMGVISTIAGLALFAARDPRNRLYGQVILAAALSSILIVLLTVSVKEILGTTAALVLFFVFRNRRNIGQRLLLGILGGTFLVSLVLVTENPVSNAVMDRIERYSGDEADRRIRTMLVASSIDIARTRFPFGSGPGTFASNPSREFGYSPIYVEYGFQYVWGGRAYDDVDYLMDGFWPKILGESGIFGFLAYLTAVLLMLRQCMKRLMENPDWPSAWFSMLMWTSIIPISFGMGIMTNERVIPLLMLAAAAPLHGFRASYPAPGASRT